VTEERKPNPRAGALRGALDKIIRNSACKWTLKVAREALREDDKLLPGADLQPVAGASEPTCPLCGCHVHQHSVGPNDEAPLHCWGDTGDGKSCKMLPPCQVTQLEIKKL